MTLNLVSNSGFSGNKGSKSVSTIGAGGAPNANFTNTATGTYSADGKNYKYITFTGSGTLTIDRAGFADILVVSGGGGGFGSNFQYSSGGDGAGGGIFKERILLNQQSYTITVGAGGAGGPAGCSDTGGPGQCTTRPFDGGFSQIQNIIRVRGNTSNGQASPLIADPFRGTPSDYGVNGTSATNTNPGGGGGGPSGAQGSGNGFAGTAGIVVVRVEI